MASSTLASPSFRCAVRSGSSASRPGRLLKRAPVAAKSVRRTALQCDATLHPGHVCIHHFGNCSESPAFGNFIEGMYHIMEVTRDHPQYQTALLHEAIDDRDEKKTNPFSYAAVAVYNDIEGGANAYLGEYEDLQVSLEFSIKKPHYQAVLREVAVLPEGVDSPLSAGEASKTANTDLVCLAFYDKMWEGPEAVRLAGELAAIGGASSVALYKAEGGDFACSLRCEFADLLGDKMDGFDAVDEAFAKIAASAEGLVHAGVYRVLFAVPKSGSPVGLVAAQMATDEANKRGINTDDFDGGATVVDDITKGL